MPTKKKILINLLQIIIQGFKSYKDQTAIEPFSPKSNVIGKKKKK